MYSSHRTQSYIYIYISRHTHSTVNRTQNKVIINGDEDNKLASVYNIREN